MTVTQKLQNILVIFAFAWLAQSVPVNADGLQFHESMRGYAKINSLYKNLRVQLSVTIDDVAVWRNDPLHSGSITGVFIFNESVFIPLTGTINILAASPADCFPSKDCYRLVYRLNSVVTTYPGYAGYKLVRAGDNSSLMDDMTHLRGCFTTNTQQDLNLLVQDSCLSSLWFEWWDVANLFSFTSSFKPINTPWWRYFDVQVQFLEIVFGSLARAHFPWFY